MSKKTNGSSPQGKARTSTQMWDCELEAGLSRIGDPVLQGKTNTTI